MVVDVDGLLVRGAMLPSMKLKVFDTLVSREERVDVFLAGGFPGHAEEVGVWESADGTLFKSP